MEQSLPVNLELNQQFAYALHVMENTNKNLFVTGKAGTGKSTLLQYFRNNTKKNIVVLAPTGVAAVNVRGQTIHSFFNFKPDVTPATVEDIKPRSKNIYKKLDTIIIDEISMVRADLLDSIDIFLRKHGKTKKKPFGGIQMIFIGDLYQLPPVVTYREKQLFTEHYKSPYFFDAKVFDHIQLKLLDKKGSGFEMELIELEKIYRQKDEEFIDLLNAIRNNTVNEEQLARLNCRYYPDFNEPENEFYIYLTSTNDLANAINNEKLSRLDGKLIKYRGEINGEFHSKDLPTAEELELKIGAQVMLLNNDSYGRWINGTLGIVKDIEKNYDEPDVIVVELADKTLVEVLPYNWEMFRFYYDEKENSILSEPVGSFLQYPLRLAWAVTIHKSQGKTFDRVIIDIGSGTFSHGQMYVALSRCTTLDGIVLKQKIQKKHIMMDFRVVNFVTRFQYAQAEKKCSTNDKICIFEEAIKSKKHLEILYLKTKDEKSRRIILPLYVGHLSYNGKTFLGLKAFCTTKKEERTFRLDRILEINEA